MGEVAEQKEKVNIVEVKLKIRPWDKILDNDPSTYTGNSRVKYQDR